MLVMPWKDYQNTGKIGLKRVLLKKKIDLKLSWVNNKNTIEKRSFFDEKYVMIKIIFNRYIK